MRIHPAIVSQAFGDRQELTVWASKGCEYSSVAPQTHILQHREQINSPTAMMTHLLEIFSALEKQTRRTESTHTLQCVSAAHIGHLQPLTSCGILYKHVPATHGPIDAHRIPVQTELSILAETSEARLTATCGYHIAISRTKSFRALRSKSVMRSTLQ